MSQVDLLNLAVILQAVMHGITWFRLRRVDAVLREHALELGALREHVGLTDEDIDAYHERVHPECAPPGRP